MTDDFIDKLADKLLDKLLEKCAKPEWHVRRSTILLITYLAS